MRRSTRSSHRLEKDLYEEPNIEDNPPPISEIPKPVQISPISVVKIAKYPYRLLNDVYKNRSQQSVVLNYWLILDKIQSFFDTVVLKPISKQILLTAYAPIHTFFMNSCFSIKYDDLLPFSNLWNSFYVAFKIIGFPMNFNPDLYLLEIQRSISDSSEEIQEAFEIFSSIFHQIQFDTITQDTIRIYKDAVDSFYNCLKGIDHNKTDLFAVFKVFRNSFEQFVLTSEMRLLIENINSETSKSPLFFEHDYNENDRKYLIQSSLRFALHVLSLYQTSEKGEILENSFIIHKLLYLCSYNPHEFKSLYDEFKEKVLLFSEKEFSDSDSICHLSKLVSSLPPAMWLVSSEFSSFFKYRNEVVNSVKFGYNITNNLFSQFIGFIETFKNSGGYEEEFFDSVYRPLLIYSSMVLVPKLKSDLHFLEEFIALQNQNSLSIEDELSVLIDQILELSKSDLINEKYIGFSKRYVLFLQTILSIVENGKINGNLDSIKQVQEFIPNLLQYADLFSLSFLQKEPYSDEVKTYVESNFLANPIDSIDQTMDSLKSMLFQTGYYIDMVQYNMFNSNLKLLSTILSTLYRFFSKLYPIKCKFVPKIEEFGISKQIYDIIVCIRSLCIFSFDYSVIVNRLSLGLVFSEYDFKQLELTIKDVLENMALSPISLFKQKPLRLIEIIQTVGEDGKMLANDFLRLISFDYQGEIDFSHYLKSISESFQAPFIQYFQDFEKTYSTLYKLQIAVKGITPLISKNEYQYSNILSFVIIYNLVIMLMEIIPDIKESLQSIVLSDYEYPIDSLMKGYFFCLSKEEVINYLLCELKKQYSQRDNTSESKKELVKNVSMFGGICRVFRSNFSNKPNIKTRIDCIIEIIECICDNSKMLGNVTLLHKKTMELELYLLSLREEFEILAFIESIRLFTSKIMRCLEAIHVKKSLKFVLVSMKNFFRNNKIHILELDEIDKDIEKEEDIISNTDQVLNSIDESIHQLSSPPKPLLVQKLRELKENVNIVDQTLSNSHINEYLFRYKNSLISLNTELLKQKTELTQNLELNDNHYKKCINTMKSEYERIKNEIDESKRQIQSYRSRIFESNARLQSDTEKLEEMHQRLIGVKQSMLSQSSTLGILEDFEKQIHQFETSQSEIPVQHENQSFDMLRMTRELQKDNIRIKYAIKRATIANQIPELYGNLPGSPIELENEERILQNRKNELVSEISSLESNDELCFDSLYQESGLKSVQISDCLVSFLKYAQLMREGKIDLKELKSSEFFVAFDGTEKLIYELSQNRRELDIFSKGLIKELEEIPM